MNDTLITPSSRECTWGFRYLLFQLIFLGSFISLIFGLLGIPLTAAWLNILYFAVNFIVVLLLCRRFLGATMEHGLRHFLKSLAWAGGGFLVYEAISMGLARVIVLLQPGFSNVNDENLSAISQGNFVLMTLCTVLMVPLTEEVFYRGVIFGGLYRRSRLAAYAVSVLAFSLVHVSGYIGTADPVTLLLCFAQYIPAGFCLAFVYERSGSLLPSVLIHTAVNAIGMLAMR